MSEIFIQYSYNQGLYNASQPLRGYSSFEHQSIAGHDGDSRDVSLA